MKAEENLDTQGACRYCPERRYNAAPTTVSWRHGSMKCLLALLCIVLIVSCSLATVDSPPSPPPNRQVAITIDDLPAGRAQFMSAAAITEMTAKLVAVLQQEKIPAVGFVN